MPPPPAPNLCFCHAHFRETPHKRVYVMGHFRQKPYKKRREVQYALFTENDIKMKNELRQHTRLRPDKTDAHR